LGNQSELSVLLIVGTLLSSFIFIGSLIPAQYVAGVVNGTRANVPSAFEGYKLLGWNSSSYIVIKHEDDNQSGIGGYNIDVTAADYAFIVNTYAYYGIWSWDQDFFEWFQNGTQVSESTLLYGYSKITLAMLQIQATANDSLTYDIRNSHTNFQVSMAWDKTTYGTNITHAYEHDNLRIMFNAAFDWVGSQINGWTLVTGLMTFSLPDVPSWIQYLIAVPVWIGLAYISFIFVLRMIGAVFGGGGA
jgi:hypothetical protein